MIKNLVSKRAIVIAGKLDTIIHDNSTSQFYFYTKCK